jgi:hypothetical protein
MSHHRDTEYTEEEGPGEKFTTETRRTRRKIQQGGTGCADDARASGKALCASRLRRRPRSWHQKASLGRHHEVFSQRVPPKGSQSLGRTLAFRCPVSGLLASLRSAGLSSCWPSVPTSPPPLLSAPPGRSAPALSGFAARGAPSTKVRVGPLPLAFRASAPVAAGRRLPTLRSGRRHTTVVLVRGEGKLL